MTKKMVIISIGVLLFMQLFTEGFLLLFEDGTVFYEYAYYIPMRLFHIGLLPSIILFYFCKTRLEKVFGLTLVYSQLFWSIREIISLIDGCSWLVLRVSSIDVCWIIFIAFPLILSIITDAVCNSFDIRNNSISILLSRHRANKKNNQKNTNPNGRY